MKRIFTLVLYDYLQRVRSYQFLIILCASLAFAYTLIPAPGDIYSTVRIGEYLGNYNTAWIGYVSAIMSSVFVTLIGYYLVNNSIKIDQTTRVGHIVAATSITNFHYLIAKFLGNFLVLLTVVALIFFMSIVLFFMYSSGYPFEITHFLLAYLLIPIPTIFFISALAVILEVFFGNKSVLQNGVFFILFMIMLAQGSRMGIYSDAFGTNFPTTEMEKQVDLIKTSPDKQELNIGFIIGRKSLEKRFDFTGVSVPFSYVFFRTSWALLGLLLIFIASRFFHRFELKERLALGAKKDKPEHLDTEPSGLREMDLSLFPSVEKSMSIWPVFKTELLMMVRKGSKWLWGLNFAGMTLLVFIPIEPAHKIVLPILWFLQVHRWADLVTKEKRHQMHYFIFSSFKPVQRLLTSQWMAAIALAIGLALPIVLRYALLGQLLPMAAIIMGAIFIIALTSFIGIATGGKRLFEILFFFIAYLNVNNLPFTDYFGGVNPSVEYLLLLGSITAILGVLSFLLRKFELSRV
jgi:hypothetical protein